MSQNHIIPTHGVWKPGALTLARKRRMRLAWSVWFVAAIFVLFQFFLQLSSGEMISGLMHSFSLSALGGGVLASSYYYIYVLLQTPAGILMDRYGPRGVLSAGALVVFVGCLLFSIAKTVGFALLGRVLMGAGAAFAFVGCLNVIAIWFPARRFALMAAIVETAGMLGAIVGNFWLAHFIQQVGWRICFIVAGIFAGILSFCLVSIVRNAPRKKKPSLIDTVKVPLRAGLHTIFKNPIAWINGIYSGLMFSIVTVFIALWAIPFLELSHHIHLLQATLVACALYTGVAVGGPVIGWLDGKKNWRKQMMVVNALGASGALFAVIFCHTLPLLAVAILLFFAGVCASSYVLTFAIANEIASPANRATCIGFTNMLCVAFAPILQPLIGFFIARSHAHPVFATTAQSITSFSDAVSVVPTLLLVAAAIGFFLPNKRYRHKQRA